MSQYLFKPEPVPYVCEDDLLAIAGDKGAGVFSAADLYDWYVSIARETGREPVGKRWFGLALKEAGWASSTRKIHGAATRCWLITLPWARRGAEHVQS